jgi:hypothetical protein
MRHDDDAAPMSPAERRAAVAAILALGVLRLRQRVALPPENDPKKNPKSGQDCLEVPGKTVLSVHTG